MSELLLDRPSGDTAAENEVTVDPRDYDRVLIAFSGGKDSLACLINMLDAGVDPARIELHHHDVDGGDPMVDWPVTPDYCRRVAAAFGVPIYFSEKEGGFRREMMRDGTPTAPIRFDLPDGTRGSAGGNGPAGTRLKFPQVAADLSVRWCSAYLKIDVMAALIRNQERFLSGRTLVVTGERAQESTARSRYKDFEVHRTDTRDGSRRARHVDHLRPILRWPEEHVWETISRRGVAPHPCYMIGLSRASCGFCIFADADQLATLRHIWPDRFEEVAATEERLGSTIKRKLSVREMADKGAIHQAALDNPEAVRLLLSEVYDAPIMLEEASWKLPAGAFGHSAGPL